MRDYCDRRRTKLIWSISFLVWPFHSGHEVSSHIALSLRLR